MALTNDLGTRLSDFRVNVANPDLARLQAVGQTEARLRQQGAAGLPNMQELSKLISQGDMHSVDEQSYFKQLNTLQGELNIAAADPISAFYSKEGRALRTRIQSLINNPKRMELTQNFELNKEQLKKAKDRGTLGDIYVNQGQIGGNRGLYGTLMDHWKFVDQRGGGENLLDFSQSNFADARTRIEVSLARAGKTKLTQFQGEDGDSPTLTKIVTSQNNRQIDLALKSLIDDGAISQSDYDAFLSRAATNVVRRARGEGRELTLQEVQSAAQKEMGEMIRGIGDLQRDYEEDITIQKNPNLSGAGGKLGMEDVAPITSTFLRQRANLAFMANGSHSSSGYLAQVPATRTANALLATGSQLGTETAGFRGLNNNLVLGSMGANRADRLMLGTLNQTADMNYDQMQAMIDRAEVIGDMYTFAWPIGNDGRLLSEEDAQDYTNLENLYTHNRRLIKEGGSPVRLNGLLPEEVMAQKGYRLGTVPVATTEIRVGFEEGGFMTSSEDSELIKQLETINVGGLQEFRDDQAAQYRESAGYGNEKVKEGSQYWQGPVQWIIDENFNINAINSIELGRTTGVDERSAGPTSPTIGANSVGTKAGTGNFPNFNDR